MDWLACLYMRYRQLGNSDVKVSEISLGCWALGGPSWAHGKPSGWAKVDEAEVTQAVKLALDAGVNHFDNADIYGNGEAERRLGRVLRRLGVSSERLVIASKVGHFPGTAAHAYEPFHIRRQCEQSLLNLRRDYLDIYYLHHTNFGRNYEYLAPAAAVLDELVREGKIRLKGQSAYTFKGFQIAVPVVRPTVLQSWAHAMAAEFIQAGNPLPRLMAEHQLSLVAFSPLNQGLLLGKYDPARPPVFADGDHRSGQQKFLRPALLDLKPRIERIKAHFGSRPDILASVALRFVLNHDHVACVIPGFRDAGQVACNLAVVNFQLSRAETNFVYQTFNRKPRL